MQNQYKQVLVDEYNKPLTDAMGHELTPLNYNLLRDLIAWAAEDHAKLDRLLDGDWEQGTWSQKVTNGVCKTSYCIAGQAVVQAGYGLDYQVEEDDDDGITVWSAAWCAPQLIVGVNDDGTPKYELDDEKLEPIEDVAMRAIGLTKWEAMVLFYAGNDIREVTRLANECARRRGLPLVREYDKVAD